MKLRHFVLVAAGIWLMAFTCRPAMAEVRVGINIGIPLFTFQAPPELAVIPGSYIYFVPGIDEDIRFYEGRWYRHWNNRWHRSRNYNGPWTYLAPRYVPAPFLRIRPDFRQRVPKNEWRRYDDVNRHWRRWEKDRYWETKHDWWREKQEQRHDDRDNRGKRDHRDDRDNRHDDHGNRGR